MSIPQRIMVIGPSGSGKSTTARLIGERLKLPVTHLDVLFWKPGWVESDDADFRARIADAAGRDAWVIDGNYSRHMDLRLARAEAVIFLDLPRSTFFTSALMRCVRNFGRERGDIGPGCPERFDWSFFRDWVWPYPTKGRPKAVALMEGLRPEVRGITLTSRRAVKAFVDALPASLHNPRRS